MNCPNCGGTMKVVDGRHYLCCSYCSTFLFPTELKDSADRVQPLETPGEGGCPQCQTSLSRGMIEGCEIDFCEQCRGILVDSLTFSHIVNLRRAQHKGPDDSASPLDAGELSRQLDCPRCNRRMEVHPYYGPGNAVIDSCHRCEVIWLDHGELGAIERAPGKR